MKDSENSSMGMGEYEFLSVNDMQEWILQLQKLVRALENSKLLLLATGQRPGNAAQHMILPFSPMHRLWETRNKNPQSL